MKVAVAGASGFIGERVLRDLLAAGHEPIALSRTDSGNGLPTIVTSFDDVALLRKALPSDLDAIIFLPGIIREFPARGIRFQDVHVEAARTLMAAAKAGGVSRWIHMSALGASKDATTPYFITKWEAEDLVRGSGMDWTIIRPSIVFPDEPTQKANFASDIVRGARLAPVFPIFGDGRYRMQPIARSEVSKAFVTALTTPSATGETFTLGGPEVFRYKEVIREILAGARLKRSMIHIPVGLAKAAASLLDRFEFFPFTEDQITMLLRESVAAESERTKADAVFGRPTILLREGLKQYFGHKSA